eukprot:3693758-Amphidinium_carterae.1
MQSDGTTLSGTQEVVVLHDRGKSDVKLVVALLNLQRLLDESCNVAALPESLQYFTIDCPCCRLAKDRPETKATEARDALVDFVQRRLKALQDVH